MLAPQRWAQSGSCFHPALSINLSGDEEPTPASSAGEVSAPNSLHSQIYTMWKR